MVTLSMATSANHLLVRSHSMNNALNMYCKVLLGLARATHSNLIWMPLPSLSPRSKQNTISGPWHSVALTSGSRGLTPSIPLQPGSYPISVILILEKNRIHVEQNRVFIEYMHIRSLTYSVYEALAFTTHRSHQSRTAGSYTNQAELAHREFVRNAAGVGARHKVERKPRCVGAGSRRGGSAILVRALTTSCLEAVRLETRDFHDLVG